MQSIGRRSGSVEQSIAVRAAGGIRPRWAIIAAGVVILVLVGAVVIAWRMIAFGRPGLVGTVLDPPVPASDFTLSDQFNQPVSLSGQRGKVVVLTFLYTNCPDACPLITQKLHQAYDLLGPDVSGVSILAVTVDPDRDTVARVRQYSVEKDMLGRWHFLVGPRSRVQPVWEAYGVAAVPSAAGAGQASDNSIVDHSALVYLIDPAGRERVILDADFAPADLVADIRALRQGA